MPSRASLLVLALAVGGTVEAQTGEISGSVWLDQDGDGLQDAGEPFSDGVSVNLLDSGGGFLQSQVTSGGVYLFASLTPDDYIVEVLLPSGEIFTLQDVGADDTVDSDVDPADGRTGIITVAASTSVDVDAGFMGRGEIGGTVWLDQDGDGLQNGFEPRVDGVTVNLLDGAGGFLQKQVTDGGGFYYFPMLLPGTYIIEVIAPPGEVFTQQDAGNDGADSDVDPVTGRSGLLAVDAGGGVLVDAGFMGRGEIGGVVWLDQDGDGIQDPGENRIERVEVHLLDAGGGLLDTVFTNSGGLYVLPNLLPGTFIVEVVLPSGQVFTFQDVGGDDSVDSDVDPATGRTGLVAVDAGAGWISDAGLMNATWSHITDLRAVRDRGQVVVEWETRAEAGTVGFVLHRQDPVSGELMRVREQPIQSLLVAPQGGVYRVVDESVHPTGQQTYWLEELTADGASTLYGPFIVEVGAEQAQRAMEAEVERRPRKGRRAYLDALARKPLRSKARLHGRPSSLARIAVSARGLVFVSASDIASALDLPRPAVRGLLRARQFSLSHEGRSVPWLRADSGLYFFAPGIDSVFTDQDVYWLRRGRGRLMRPVDGRPGSDHDSVTGFLAAAHFEEDLEPVTLLPFDPESDYWFWARLSPGHPRLSRRSFAFTVEEIDRTSLDEASLTVHLQGLVRSSLSNVATISLNGTPIGEARFADLASHAERLVFDLSLLEAGENTLTIQATADVPGAHVGFAVDGFDLLYPRTYRATGPSLELRGATEDVTISDLSERRVLVLDVTTPRRPKRVTGVEVRRDGSSYAARFAARSPVRRYWVSGPSGAIVPDAIAGVSFRDLLSPSNAAEYLVIAPSELASAAAELVELRESQGLSSTLVTLEEIVDEVQDGLFSPHAVRDFLRIALTTWQVPPRYVVLVGRGTFDYKDNLGIGDNLLPPYMLSTSSGLHPSDHWLADVVGEDGVPEAAIGRIPVLSGDELRAYVDKLVVYEAGGSWARRVAFLADDPDAGGDFTRDSDTLAALLRPGETPIPIYLADASVAQTRQLLFDTLEEGVGQLNYFGHAGSTALATEGLLTTEDIDLLAAAGHPALVTAFTCSVNYFAAPGVESLGEALMRVPDRGAVAVWGPSWLSGNGFARALGEVFFAERAAGEGRLGDQVHTALEALAARGLPRSAAERFVLLGDPATRLP